MFTNFLKSEILKKIEVICNERISEQTIKVYGDLNLNQEYNDEQINDIIKKLYSTNFFSNISTSFSNGILKIMLQKIR